MRLNFLRRLPQSLIALPNRGLRRVSRIRLKSGSGVLSAVQSRDILEGIGGGGRGPDLFARHLALEEAIVGSPLSTGNRVLLLQDGPATYQAMYAAILGAQDHINIETYILDDDAVGQSFAQALIDKQREGVQVNMIHDSIGTFTTPSSFFQRLAESGIRVLEFNPVNPLSVRKVWELNRRDHRKLLIVDGRIAFLGGINISSVYSGGSFNAGSRIGPDTALAWRDTDLQLEGPVVAEFQKLFLAAWDKQSGQALALRKYFPTLKSVGHEVVRAIGSSPEDSYSLIYVALLLAIRNARVRVHLINAYFVPDPRLLATLEAAAKRGVDVTVILPSQTDAWLVFHAGRSYYGRLLQSGVKIYERRGVILHSKVALIDGVWATIGSTNLDWRSFLHNYEVNAVVLGVNFGNQVQAMFKKDLDASEAITHDQWKRRPMVQRAKEMFARVWKYWL